MIKRVLVQKIKQEFPELKWKNAKHNVEGWDHYVIILDNKYVFRFPRNKHYMAKLENEISLLGYLKDKVKISIPNYTYVAQDKTFAGYELIHGQQLKKKVFKKLPKKTIENIVKQMADFLSTLHKTPMSVAKNYNPKSKSTKVEYSEIISRTRKHIIPKLGKRDKILTEAFFKDLKSYLNFPNKVFVHRNLYSSHILVDKKGITGIIDFSDKRIDDPARDFTELWDYGEAFVNDVYKLYKGPKDKDFIERSLAYYKTIPFKEMYSRFYGGRGSFKGGYRMFKDRFLGSEDFDY